MSYIFEDNLKMRTLKKTNDLKCKCGSVRYTVKVFDDDADGERKVIAVHCKACGNLLFYNGA